MFILDESFLDMVGLGDMPEEQKNDFLAYAQDQLETRIGEKMSSGLSEEQIDEFERIMDNDQNTINAIVGTNYRNDALYQTLLQNSDAEEGTPEFLNDFATAKWLSQNYPQYQDTIRDTFNNLRDEISSQSAAILANA